MFFIKHRFPATSAIVANNNIILLRFIHGSSIPTFYSSLRNIYPRFIKRLNFLLSTIARTVIISFFSPSVFITFAIILDS